VAGVDRLGAERLGPGEPLGDHVDGEDAGRAEERGALQRHDADGPQPHDDDGRSRADGRPERAQVAGREDVGQQDGLVVGDTLGNTQREGVGKGDGHGLGLPTGEVGHGSERGGLAGEAHVGLAGAAGAAHAAADHAGDEHAIAPPQALHVRSGLQHRPDGLVAQADADPGRRIVVEVEIGAADRGALDLDDDPVGTGERGIGHVFDPHVARPFEDGGSHSRTLHGTTLVGAEIRGPEGLLYDVDTGPPLDHQPPRDRR